MINEGCNGLVCIIL
ncbi:MAG: hypothetical protein ACLR56_07605 [Oscillospiraceae bacterium]